MAYKKPQSLVDYISRIGAEELSFRRFIVRSRSAKFSHYYEEKALIMIDARGKIKVSGPDAKEHEPTKKEQEEIEKGLMNSDFPRSIGAKTTRDLAPLLTQAGEIYEIWNRRDGTIAMVQHAYREENGSKRYVPWSLWSDGEWRNMEPESRLPFWKPRVRTMAARLMIHEGAKAARCVQEEIVDRGGAGHPWAEELSLYEHWGMLGGALAPHRSLYEEIGREGFIEVVYACDNDGPGHSALQEVSKHYGKAMRGFRPDDNFKESWDLADPMPAKFFSGTRWNGPLFKDLIVPATYATEEKTIKDKKVIVLKRAFKEEWLHVVRPEVFIHRDWPNQIFETMQQFNNRIMPYSQVKNTAELLMKDDASKTGILKYSPAKPPGIYSDDEPGRFINTHVPSSIKPEKGDVTPWLEFIEHLIPIESDRKGLLRWIATLISRPEVKMLYGMLLISEVQGVGKGTLGEKILAPLVGIHNTSFPSEQEIVDSNYNYWQTHKRLAVVHEIYAGHSAKAYNRLKSVITDKNVDVLKKYMAVYNIENWIHVFACSNSIRAIQLSSEDRRWFIPKVTEKKKSPSYWVGFFDWLNCKGGLGAIRWWCDMYVNDPSHVVMSGEDAPWTSVKQEVVEEGKSASEKYLIDVLKNIKYILGEEDEHAKKKKNEWREKGYLINDEEGVFTLDTELQEVLKHKFYNGHHDERLLKLITIRKNAKEVGMFSSKDQIKVKREWNTTSLLVHSKIISTSKNMAEITKSTDMKQKPLTALELGEM